MSTFEELVSLSRQFPSLSIRCEAPGTPPSCVSIWLSGSLDNDSSVPFVKAVDKLITENPTLNTISIDVSGIRYLSSTGIGAIGSIFLASQRHQINFTLVDPSPHVEMLLKLLGFASFLPIARQGSPDA